MSAETFVWPEGAIYLWTGTATASAVPGYAQNIQATFTLGWDNFWTLSGQPRDTLTGQRVDVQIGGLVTIDTALAILYNAKTAVHMHIKRSGFHGSAGHLLYSGRIDQRVEAGSEGAVDQYSLVYHANIWSAY